MSILGSVFGWVVDVASSSNAPRGPWDGSGPLAAPGAAGDSGGCKGPGGPGGPDDGPPTLSDLARGTKDALGELGDIAKEVFDIATKDDRTEDEQIAFDAGTTSGEDALLDNVPGTGIGNTGLKGAKVGYEGIKNVKNYNNRRTNILDSIANDSLDGTPDFSGDD